MAEAHPTTEVGELPLEDPFPAAPLLPSPQALTPLERARLILSQHPVADGCCALPSALRALPWYDLELGESAVETDVPRLREGQVGAVFWALRRAPGGSLGELDRASGAGRALSGSLEELERVSGAGRASSGTLVEPHRPSGAGRALSGTLEQLDLARAVVRAHPEGLRLAGSAGEVIDARKCGRVAVLLGPADAAALDDSLAVLRVLRDLGLRALTLAGTGWASEAGLTRFGEEVVREMNRLGVIADLSGASDATIARALALSKTPVLCTRSGARALRDHPDNLSDAQLKALGEARGVCMVPLTADQTGPELRDVADHLDHVRELAGPEAVALSGAYDSGAAHPDGLNDVSRYPNLIAELLERGWGEAEVALLSWGNVQRVVRGADFLARAARERTSPPPALAP